MPIIYKRPKPRRRIFLFVHAHTHTTARTIFVGKKQSERESERGSQTVKSSEEREGGEDEAKVCR